MVSLDNEQICLLELIKASLFGKTPKIPFSVNWEKVFEAAKLQCIVPLVVSNVPEEHRAEWNVVSCQSKARFIKIMYEQNCLVELLNRNRIPYVILKGTAAAIYLPTPSLRTYGDIDFYVQNDNCNKAIKTLKENGYIFLDNNERHYEFEKNGVVFELHSRFSYNAYNDIEHYLINGLNNAVKYQIGNYSFRGLPVYENGLVLLGHTMQHLKSTGIGFRQVIDWIMFVNKELDDSAWENHFKKLANEAGLEKLAVTVTLMCKKWLGLPEEITWCDSADEEVADQLLIRMLDDGNFGRDRAPRETVKVTIKNEGTFKYLQHAGIINWPLAQKYAILRPFAWFYQLCRYLGKGITGLLNGEKIFMKNKSNMSIEELWERLE